MSNRKIRVRGFVRTDDGSTPALMALTIDGTETAIAVGASDVLYIDSYNFGATTGLSRLFFSDDGVDNENKAKIAQFGTWGSLAFPVAVFGRVGDSLYLGSSGVNRVEGTVTGYIIRG